MKKTIAGALLALLAVTASANSGMSAFNRKDYNEAYRIWSRAPEAAESQYGLGVLNLEGLGGPKNIARGVSLLKSSSDKGYKPATEYLANHFEKYNEHKEAIRYLERLQTQQKSLQTQQRIVSAHIKLTKGQPTRSADYCGAANELSKLGGSPDEGTPEMCALNGFTSSVSLEQAKSWLTSNFNKNPSIEGVETLAEELLNPKSTAFDPALIEEAVWKLDPKLTNQTLKKILLEKGKVKQDVCRSLPFRLPEQRARFSAYCTLVVIAGENPNPLLVAREYVNSSQGRVSLRGKEPIERGLRLLATQAGIFESNDGTYLRLEAYRRMNDWKSTLMVLEEKRNSLLDSKSEQTQLALKFLLERADYSSPQNTVEFDQESALKVALLVSSLPSGAESKAYACKALAPYVSDEHTNPADSEQRTRKQLITALDGTCKEAGLSRPDPGAIPPPNKKQQTAPSTTRNSSSSSSLQREAAKPILATGSFDSDLFACNQGQASACAPAALAILSPNPPAMYQSLSGDQRTDVAEKILLNGAKVEDVPSLAVLIDIYENGLDSNKRPIAQRYLNLLLSKGEPAGILRQEIQSLPKDPISGILGGTFLRSKNAATCDRIRQLRDSNRLTAYDKNIADEAYNGLMCKSVR